MIFNNLRSLCSLCSSCTNIRCELQSGIVRTECAFYMPPRADWHDIPSDEMTLEQARQVVKELRKYVMDNHILSKSKNMISRQTVKEQMIKYGFHASDMTVTEFVEDLPLINPQEPKIGHWRPVYQGEEIINYRCSECEFGNTFGKGTFRMNYCPNCGAKMDEVKK